jgi:protein TonB
MRREAFVLNDVPRWRVMPVGASCLLHVGLIAGLVLGQQWVLTVVAVRPPVLPVQLVTLEDQAEPARPSPPPPERPRRERLKPSRRPEPAQPATLEEPAPQPSVATPAPAELVTAPVPASPPAVSEPAIAPALISSAPAPPSSLPPAPPAVAKAPSTAPDGITQTARPQGGYQVRPAYPAAPRRLGIQGTVLLRVHVLADGRIGDILVERSAGHPDLDHAAAEAVRRWRFEPARRGADAVGMWVLLPVEFRLTP